MISHTHLSVERQRPQGLVSHHLELDVRELARHGLLEIGHQALWVWYRGGELVAARALSFEAAGLLVLPLEAALLDPSERPRGPNWIQLEYTACHLGGQRPWWACPQCERRVAIVYERDGYWACRTCSRLAYPSQRERAPNRALRQVAKVRRRLGWPRGLALPSGDRPKGMHARTYERLVERHDRYAAIALADANAWLDRTARRGPAVRIRND